MKVLAFYLPQFHPIPENDRWWGTGFTEWRSVAASRPRFPGHHQPQLPADLGFYDLRLPEVMGSQARLAADHGIDGFCVYHYWFNGDQLLERPLDQLLERPDIEFPFVICWANENWTRRWDGKDREVLAAQDYEAYDPRAHLRHCARYFADDRYLRDGEKPIFVVYDASAIPDFETVAASWQDEARLLGFAGLSILIVGRAPEREHDWLDKGIVEAVVDFVPSKVHPKRGMSARFLAYAARLALRGEAVPIPHLDRGVPTLSKWVSYRRMVAKSLFEPLAPGHVPCIMPSWDNTARRRRDATIIQNLDPDLFGAWARDALRKSQQQHGDRALVFVNAWNEWAEGCHLEPDSRTGTGFLRAFAAARDAQFGPG